MPLRFDLGPFEKLHIGKTVLSNSHERACFTFEGEVPILRGRDVLKPAFASNAVEKLYCNVQQIYLEQGFSKYQGSYLALTLQALKEGPEYHSQLEEVDALVRKGEYYQALKQLKKLIKPSVFTVDEREPRTYVRRQILAPISR